jgi:hypothetical protein
MKYRKLRIAWSVAWGVVAVLLCVLWVRSYWAFDRVSSKSLIMVSYAGRLTAVIRDSWSQKWPMWDSGPILPKSLTYTDLSKAQVSWKDTDVVWPERGVIGFGWISQSMYLNVPKGPSGWQDTGLTARSVGVHSTGGMVPHWFCVAFIAALIAAPWLRFRFSLRTLLIATTLVTVGLGLAVYVAKK